MPRRFGSEGHVRQFGLPKGMGENHVREKNRSKDQTARHEIARENVAKQERLGTDNEIQAQNREKQEIENPDATNLETRVQEDSDQDAGENGEKDERVDIPSAAEEKSEGGERLHLQQSKGETEEEHVPIEAAQRAPRRDPKNSRERD